MTEVAHLSDARGVGLALGGGAARGWAHIGVLRALAEQGVQPEVVCGTSIGALVGAAYVMDKLDVLEGWVRELSTRHIMSYLDIRLVAGGGFFEGTRLVNFFRELIGDAPIETLAKPYAAVATNLNSGREVWVRRGSLWDAVRASIALPGVFTPIRLRGQWLVDGGLVNPVPVAPCRAFGAPVVIAVNLNGDLLSSRLAPQPRDEDSGEDTDMDTRLLRSLPMELKKRASAFVSQLLEPSASRPGLLDLLAGSINIMQDRITRSRMAGDPPDVILAPHVGHIRLLEFDRAAEAIEEGRACVQRMLPALRDALAPGAEPSTAL